LNPPVDLKISYLEAAIRKAESIKIPITIKPENPQIGVLRGGNSVVSKGIAS
jgi:hypothetical protein